MKFKLTVISLIVLAVLTLITAFGGPQELTSESDGDMNGLFKDLTTVKVLKPITIEVEGTDSDMTLIVGEEPLLIQIDNESKVMIETLTGLKGCIKIDTNHKISGTEYRLNDVFEVIQ